MLVAHQHVVQPDAQRAARQARSLLEKRKHFVPPAMVARVHPGPRHVKYDVIAQQPRDHLQVPSGERLVEAANDAPRVHSPDSSARSCMAVISLVTNIYFDI